MITKEFSIKDAYASQNMLLRLFFLLSDVPFDIKQELSFIKECLMEVNMLLRLSLLLGEVP